MIIAIDGTAGSGKSTTAKRLAKELSFFHIDSGSLYRVVTYFCIMNKIDSEDNESLTMALNNIDITNVDFLQIVKNSNDEYLNNKKNVHQLYSAIGKFNYKKYFNNYYNYKYEMLISLLDGCHGLSGNDPIFYFDTEKNKFKHIYYDGMFFEN